jgi:hypothetical protein
MFRPSDVRRAQAAFDDAIDPPYEATVTLSPDRLTLRTTVVDPDNGVMPVANGSWQFDPLAIKTKKQPSEEELNEIATQFNTICLAHYADKAGN